MQAGLTRELWTMERLYGEVMAQDIGTVREVAKFRS
jgi:hypothetical protein